MKTLISFLLLVAIATLITMQACSDSDLGIQSSGKTESIITPRSTLSEIQASGVADANDFDVLRSNNIYPFNVPSSTDFSDYKAAAIFDCSHHLIGGTYRLGNLLTENQYKIWMQIALHKNIDLQSGGSYLSPVLNEQQYQNNSGWASEEVMPGYWPELIQDPVTCEWYCEDGFGECTTFP